LDNRSIKISRGSDPEKNDRKLNVMPKLEFIEIKERILHSFFNSLKVGGKIENPS